MEKIGTKYVTANASMNLVDLKNTMPTRPLYYSHGELT